MIHISTPYFDERSIAFPGSCSLNVNMLTKLVIATAGPYGNSNGPGLRVSISSVKSKNAKPFVSCSWIFVMYFSSRPSSSF